MSDGVDNPSFISMIFAAVLAVFTGFWGFLISRVWDMDTKLAAVNQDIKDLRVNVDRLYAESVTFRQEVFQRLTVWEKKHHVVYDDEVAQLIANDRRRRIDDEAKR